MKTLHLLLALSCALLFSGCATTATGPKPTGPELAQVMGPPVFQATINALAVASLSKNPKYIPAAQALVIAIDGVSKSEALPITGPAIKAFIAKVGVEKKLDPLAVSLISSWAEIGFDSYVATYKPAVVLSSDPNAILWINAFRNGLNDGVAIVISQPKPVATLEIGDQILASDGVNTLTYQGNGVWNSTLLAVVPTQYDYKLSR